jgi:hypothetical protein
MLQKPRMLQFQGVKDEAVLRYAEPLRTQEVRNHTAFPKGKKQGDFSEKQECTLGEHSGTIVFILLLASLLKTISFRPVFLCNFEVHSVRSNHVPSDVPSENYDLLRTIFL